MIFSTRWKQSGWLVALVVAVAALFLYFNWNESATVVQTAKVQRANLVSSLTTNGKIEPVDPRELRAEVAGNVRAVSVKEGDQVRAGQKLLELEHGEASSEVAKAEAEYEAARLELENITRGGTTAESHELESQIEKARSEGDEAARQLAISERLLKRQAVPAAEVEENRERLRKAERELKYLTDRRTRRFGSREREQAQGRVQEARAALDLARSRLGATTVTAPVSGSVYALPVRRGNFVNRGDLLAQVGDLRRLRVRAYVDEPELGRLALGQEAQVTWDALPGVTWKGKVDRLPAGVTVLGTRSVGQVDVTLADVTREEQAGKLLPNVNVNVEIITQQKGGALSLPKEAVLHEAGGRRFVYSLDGNHLRRRDVTTGLTTATRVEILSGIQEGATVALPGEGKLADGARVRTQ